MFTSQVDMINANGGSAGFNNGVYNKHMLDLWDSDLVTTDSFAAMIPSGKTALEIVSKKRRWIAAMMSTSRASSSSWRKGKVQARHDGAEQQLLAWKAGVPSQRPGGKKAHERLWLFECRKNYKLGKTTGVGATHGRSIRGKREMGRRSHLLLLCWNTQTGVAGVLEGIKQGRVKDSIHSLLRSFQYQNGKEVGQHPQNRHP